MDNIDIYRLVVRYLSNKSRRCLAWTCKGFRDFGLYILSRTIRVTSSHHWSVRTSLELEVLCESDSSITDELLTVTWYHDNIAAKYNYNHSNDVAKDLFRLFIFIGCGPDSLKVTNGTINNVYSLLYNRKTVKPIQFIQYDYCKCHDWKTCKNIPSGVSSHIITTSCNVIESKSYTTYLDLLKIMGERTPTVAGVSWDLGFTGLTTQKYTYNVLDSVGLDLKAVYTLPTFVDDCRTNREVTSDFILDPNIVYLTFGYSR